VLIGAVLVGPPELLIDKGLIGFDAETGSRPVRPELRRLRKRRTTNICQCRWLRSRCLIPG